MQSLRFVVSLSTAVVLSAAACARDPAPGTEAAAAEGSRLMRQMSDTLAGARLLHFTTSESLETPGPPSERRVVHFSRSVTVRRPDAIYFELKGTAGTKLDLAAYFDGRTVSLRDGLHGVWAQTAVPETLDAMLDDVARRFSMPVPIADVVYSVPYDAFIGPSTRGGFAGRETLDGVECAHLSYADDHVGVQIWIPLKGQPLPRRVELVYKRASGEPKARIDFTSWDLAPRVSDATFSFQPPAASTPIPFGEFTALQLSGERPASPATPATPAATGSDTAGPR